MSVTSKQTPQRKLPVMPAHLTKLVQDPTLMFPPAPLVATVNPTQILLLALQTHGCFLGIHEYEATNGLTYQPDSTPGIIFLEATRAGNHMRNFS